MTVNNVIPVIFMPGDTQHTQLHDAQAAWRLVRPRRGSGTWTGEVTGPDG